MECQAKLTRTQSSLLRSSPSVRSFLTQMDSAVDGDEEDQKPHRQRPGSKSSAAIKPSSTTGRTAPSSLRWLPLIAFATAALMLSSLYLKTEMDISTSENILLALLLVGIGLFLAGKIKQMIERSIFVFRQIYCENAKKLGFGNNRTRSSVQWYIGCERREKLKAREGVEFYSNGDVYEGEFHKGKGSGSGVYTYSVSGRYEGDWVEGKYDGYGIESWARGSRYRGQYRQGLRHGVGVYRFFTGDSYAGEWCSGQYHGVGVQTCSDGSCYVGEFRYGVKHGLGCYHFRNGDRYTGEYFGDKIHGFGVYHFANAHRYEGSWHEGRKQGFGLYTFSKGETKSGEWNCGNLKTPFSLHTDAVLRAVESARKAGESAVHLRQVDEQVDKSVMAANRAATAARVAGIKAVQNRTLGKC